MKHFAFHKTSQLLNCLLFFSAVLLSSCNQTNKHVDVKDGLLSINIDSLTRHIIVLSSDSFQGRRPFTEGEIRTVNYLKQSFASMGIEPGIPAFDAGGGIDLVEGGKETGKKLADEYNEKYYHHLSDEFDPVRWKLDGVMEIFNFFSL